jgi:hypothetical protein
MSIEELEALRAQLARAQLVENRCVRRLNALISANLSDRTQYRDLVAACQAARERSVAAYDAWNRAVKTFSGASATSTDREDIADDAQSIGT